MTRFGIGFFKSTIISDKNNLEETVFDIGSKILKLVRLFRPLTGSDQILVTFTNLTSS